MPVCFLFFWFWCCPIHLIDADFLSIGLGFILQVQLGCKGGGWGKLLYLLWKCERNFQNTNGRMRIPDGETGRKSRRKSSALDWLHCSPFWGVGLRQEGRQGLWFGACGNLPAGSISFGQETDWKNNWSKACEPFEHILHTVSFLCTFLVLALSFSCHWCQFPLDRIGIGIRAHHPSPIGVHKSRLGKVAVVACQSLQVVQIKPKDEWQDADSQWGQWQWKEEQAQEFGSWFVPLFTNCLVGLDISMAKERQSGLRLDFWHFSTSRQPARSLYTLQPVGFLMFALICRPVNQFWAGNRLEEQLVQGMWTL